MDLILDTDQEVVEYTDFNVPDINSSDPEERKLARRLRIQKRQDALQRARLRTVETEVEKIPEKPTLLQKQLEKSSEILKQIFIEGEEIVTNIRVGNDAREVDRRESEVVNKEKIMAQLNEEAVLAKQMFEEISAHWHEILKYNDPLHISDAIQSQKEKCDELIRQKDGIIEMLKNEVKMAEYKFFNDQKVQSEDISLLAKRVENQVANMRRAHRVELQNIEDVMIQERIKMMQNNDKRWEELYKKREEQELSISENKFRQRDQFEEVVTKVRLKHQERVREVKIRLERDCEVLQQEFENIKATALANSEKMDYNYQILRKREDENIIIKSNQKRTLNKLQDQINALKKKTADYKASSQAEIEKLFNEVINLQKYIAAVRQKSQTMAQTNEAKYLQVWELNSNVAKKIMHKLLKIDKLLHEQQMGIKWHQPPNKLYKLEQLESYKLAMDIINAVKDKPARADNEGIGLDKSSIAYIRTLNHVLEKIADKSFFLVEGRLKKLMADHSYEENVLVKVDNVFNALGLTKTQDVNILFTFFRPYIKCPICTAESMTASISDSKTSDIRTLLTLDGEEKKVAERSHKNELVGVREPDDVINKIIQTMVNPERLAGEIPDVVKHEGECLGPKVVETDMKSEKKDRIESDGEVSDMQATSDTCVLRHQLVIQAGCILRAIRTFVGQAFCKTKEETKSQSAVVTKSPTISRLLTEADVNKYWERFKNILDPKRVELWDALLYGMQKYHAILEDRHEIIEKLKCLRRQNQELRHMLSQYQKTDDKLRKPPCARQREIPIFTIYKPPPCPKATDK